MFICLDFGVKFQMTFQDVASRGMYGLVVLNGFVFQFLILIIVVVFGLVGQVFISFNSSQRFLSTKLNTYNIVLELFWTLVPTLILFAISLRSLSLLYFMDSVRYADLTIKIIGHQWYWTYEFLNFLGGNYD
jgi:cytochrome c oxidase subunit 2